jgi:heme/copper-type cytochrome/quinol oxidase subunit 3
MLAAASLPAAIGPMLLTGPMEQLRLHGQSSSPQFKKLHGESMIVYCAETLVLLAAGLTLPWAMREEDKSNGKAIPG